MTVAGHGPAATDPDNPEARLAAQASATEKIDQQLAAATGAQPVDGDGPSLIWLLVAGIAVAWLVTTLLARRKARP